MLVEMYADVVAEMTRTMALTVIKEDLEKESGAPLKLHYFSLVKAISRLKKRATKKSGALATRKREFKDSNEIESSQLGTGRFKYGQDVQ